MTSNFCIRYFAFATMLSCCGIVMLRTPSNALSSDAPRSDQPITIKILTAKGVPIHRLLYGINYDWNAVPATRVAEFAKTIRGLAHVTLVRYPGGWNAENYNWSNNTEKRWRKAPKVPGADPKAILGVFPMVSFITPSARAIKNPELASSVGRLSANLVRRYGTGVHIWEIGNEWWLQRGGKRNKKIRAENLARYAHLLDVVVPDMKKANPSVHLFATAEWERPNDMRRLRSLTGAKVWKLIYGISLHTYCGTNGLLFTSLPTALAKIRKASGKTVLYSSEWAVVRHHAPEDFGIHNASYTVDAIQAMAFAGIQFGAYWPPVREIPALAFESASYNIPFATGIIFGWMSRYYRGEALHVSGDPHAVAAINNGKITVIVPSYARGQMFIRIDLNGTGMKRVASAKVLFSDAPNHRKSTLPAGVAILPTHIIHAGGGETYVEFTLNPGTPGRGSAYEIARVILALE